ncbi:MAG: DUF4861 family protein [Rikenellaceae bacterium]
MRIRLPIILLSLSIISSCCNHSTLKVAAPADSDIINAVYEIKIDELGPFVVTNQQGVEVPSQLTYDGKLLLLANIEAGTTQKYRVKKGIPLEYQPLVAGLFYPQKLNDLAWENDKIGFRAYGTPNAEVGNKLYGYDIFTKRGKDPVLEDIYAPEIDPFNAAEMVRLRESGDMVAYEEFIRPLSYHLDHGKGMDYYPVGPTMGCGTAALVVGGQTIYQTYHSSHKILDNGPLRVTLQVGFDPIEIDGEMVTEERIITLDAGTHFNRIDVRYHGLTKPTKLAVGIVLHDQALHHQITDNSIAYVEPMHSVGWQIYNAVIFGDDMKGIVDLFTPEQREAHGGAYGHIQAEGIYIPDSTLTYYMGAGWNGWEVFTKEAWYKIVNESETKIKHYE